MIAQQCEFTYQPQGQIMCLPARQRNKKWLLANTWEVSSDKKSHFIQ